MPIVTDEDFWEAYLGSGGRWLGRTRAPRANDGIYPPRNVQEERITWNSKWDQKAFTMTTVDGKQQEIPLVKEHTLEELLKHTHNPRGLNEETCPPLPFFQKSLPRIGQENLWIRTGDNEWHLSYATTALIEENDESTVYFRTYTGIHGYICSCYYCKLSWDIKSNGAWAAEAIYQRTNHENRGTTPYQQRFIGHLGAIARAVRMGLVTTDGMSAESFYYINTIKPTERSRGLLERRVNDIITYAVPSFVEHEPQPVGHPSPEESMLSAPVAAPPQPYQWYADDPVGPVEPF